jgi:transcriptional regulator with XRE-family HTH domain
MEAELTLKQIGRRVMTLRKAKGLSQEELAKRIGLSRSSLTQIEKGRRNLTVLELHAMAALFSISLDEFLYADKSKDTDTILSVNETSETQLNIRISVPQLNVDKLKNVLLYMLERCAGKPNVGETVLNKLLYFCDFNYYELYEEHLTGIRYKKLPYGPVPQNLDGILLQMVNTRLLQQINTDYHGFKQTRYIPLEKANLQLFSAAEKAVIDAVILQMGDWSATTISDYSHKDKPWSASDIGEYISYNLAFYRRPPYTVRVYSDEED